MPSLGPATQYSVEEIDDWIVDVSAVKPKTTQTRHLSIYPIEQFLRCSERMQLFLLKDMDSYEEIRFENMS